MRDTFQDTLQQSHCWWTLYADSGSTVQLAYHNTLLERLSEPSLTRHPSSNIMSSAQHHKSVLCAIDEM